MNQTETQPTSDARLVTAIFQTWRRAGVRFAVLRNYQGLPDEIGNDLDLLVDESELKRAETLLIEATGVLGYINHNRAEFSPVSLYLYHETSRDQRHIDLFSTLKWRGFTILSPRAVLDHRVDRGLFAIPHPVHEATLNLLTRLLYNGYVKEAYKTGIVEAFAKEPELARATLAETLGPELARELVANVLAESWPVIETKGAQLRRVLMLRQLTKAPTQTAAALGRDLKRLTKRAARAPGLVVAFIGPDGSGKSSVAEGSMERLQPTFGREKSRYIHWKPSVLRPKQDQGGPPVVDPHGKPPRHPLVSLVYFSFHLLDFVLGSRLHLRPVTFRNGLVMIDRYYYDFFVDRQRYRLDIPEALVELGYYLVERPDLVIYLDAPPEVLQARKQEVPFEETARQRDAYFALVERLPNGHVVDASAPLEKVIDEVEGVVLGYLAERTIRRLGAQT